MAEPARFYLTTAIDYPNSRPHIGTAFEKIGADVQARYKGRTALHCAAKAGFVHVVEALIEHRADVNALDERGQTPLDEVENSAPSIDKAPVRPSSASRSTVWPTCTPIEDKCAYRDCSPIPWSRITQLP